MNKTSEIFYTYTDEAPMLATHSLLPIIKAFSKHCDINLQLSDISLAGRILAAFANWLPADKKIPNALGELGELVKQPGANIIKLPNISASIPQITAAVKELQAQGYAVPDFPQNPSGNKEEQIRQIYDGVKGSAVNPVLREGNSDRRAPVSVKNYARKHPHSMGAWSADSQTHVAHMDSGDFFGSEKSLTVDKACRFRIEYVDDSGKIVVLRNYEPLQEGEILDAAVMSCSRLRHFLRNEIQDANKQGILFSIHLKATMMKVSDPIIFGHAVSVFFHKLFEKHAETFRKLGVNPDLGLSDLISRLDNLAGNEKQQILDDLQECCRLGPNLAMVDSNKGITNLHVSSDTIVDASMPAAIRKSGQMWGPDGKSRDMKAVIPDRSYAGVYKAVINYCRDHGAFDPAVMGSVSNVGLMAQKAEEYGSHDKTFMAGGSGLIRAVNAKGDVLLSQEVEKNDLFRMCQVKNAPIKDWVALGVKRARVLLCPAVFWLDRKRAHDAQVIKKVEVYLKDHNLKGLDIRIMAPEDACLLSLKRISAGKNTISITGNVLRDYLTDLFPIMELGTSAKMLSIVPLMNGGGLFETGAGGSAPKHIQQLMKENHLRWDSLGEFLALAASFEHLCEKTGNRESGILAETLNIAVEKLLDNRKSPSRKCGELDNRGSHYFLAMYWAEALARQSEVPKLAAHFTSVAANLAQAESTIVEDLIKVQGETVNLGGYYRVNPQLTDSVMRPSETFNGIIESI